MLGARWWEALALAAGRWVLDYLTLLAALTAVHASPRPSTVLLAFCAAQFLGTLPLTPGVTIEYTVPDMYGRPWAQIWERYFEDGMQRPDDEAIFDFSR